MLVNEIKLYGEPESGEAIDDSEDSFSELEDVISKVGDYSVNCPHPHVFVFVNLLFHIIVRIGEEKQSWKIKLLHINSFVFLISFPATVDGRRMS